MLVIVMLLSYARENVDPKKLTHPIRIGHKERNSNVLYDMD